MDGILDLSNIRGIPVSVSAAGFLHGHSSLYKQLALPEPTLEKYGTNVCNIHSLSLCNLISSLSMIIVYPSIHLSIYIDLSIQQTYNHLNIHPSIHPLVYASVCLMVGPPVHPSIDLSNLTYIHLNIHPSIHSPIRLSVCLTVS